MTKVLVIGSGGREHALGWKLAQSDEVSEVIYGPGNAGTENEHKGRNVPLKFENRSDFKEVADLIEAENIGLTVVGPEVPLAGGLVDYLNNKGIDRVFGTGMGASQLEADKFFSYDIMWDTGVPQAESVKCYTTDMARQAIRRMTTDGGVVIKARGLTAGKGVTVCDSEEEAIEEISKHAEEYGPMALIAERLVGEEFSVFGICDGKSVSPLEMSFQDHKPLLDGDRGPNTGGMGAYGPAPVASAETVRDISDNILTPVVQNLRERGMEYKGFIYAGMMMTEEGPKVIEFNIRFGDPECQPAMMMLKSDLYQHLSLALEGRLDEVKMEFNPGAACCVVMASDGYPGSYEKGKPIGGLSAAESLTNVRVFHAGTKWDNGDYVTSGGRVLGVTGYSANEQRGIANARVEAYNGVGIIDSASKGVFCHRKDIGDKALNR